MTIGEMIDTSPVRTCSIDARITRATGYREELGRIARWDRNIFRRMYWRLRMTRDGALFLATDPLVGIVAMLPLAILQVNSGRAIVTGRLLGTTQAVPQYASWGTNTGVTAATDTTLFTET